MSGKDWVYLGTANNGDVWHWDSIKKVYHVIIDKPTSTAVPEEIKERIHEYIERGERLREVPV
jgi:hypothetical protein